MTNQCFCLVVRVYIVLIKTNSLTPIDNARLFICLLDVQQQTNKTQFINAVQAGLDNNALIILGDQRLDVTYQKLAQALSRTSPQKLEQLDAKLNAIMKTRMPEIEEWEKTGKSFRPDEFREFVESMKTVDTTTQLMDTFRQEVPDVWKAMVGERDVYMARGLNALPSQFQTVVAVMGLGHLKGVAQSLKGMRWSALAKPCP